MPSATVIVGGKLGELISSTLISEGGALWVLALPRLRGLFWLCAKRLCGKSTLQGRADAWFTGPKGPHACFLPTVELGVVPVKTS